MRIKIRPGDQVADLDEGRIVPHVIWLDVDSNMLCAFEVKGGRIQLDAQGRKRIYTAIGRFKYTAAERKPLPKVAHLKPDAPVLRRRERIRAPLLTVRCDAKGCSRVAAWSTIDEVAMPYERINGFNYTRALMVDRRFWCDFCYQPPRVLDAKGEVVSTDHEAGGVRPQ